jgi:hypothetical protein
MILYQLQCEQEHQFEAWFKDSQAFDKQAKRKLLNCPTCGSEKVSKALMAPRISKSNNKKLQGDLSKGSSHADRKKETSEALELRQKLKKLQKNIEEKCDYVGNNFAEEARKIHYGEVDPHGIYGETTSEDAKELVDEGIEFSSMPWTPKENA